MARYVVHSGDTLGAIATRFAVSLAGLVSVNPQLADPNRIFPGQVITIPGSFPAPGPDYVVRSGDTLGAIASRFAVSVTGLVLANPQIADPNRIFVGQVITVPGSSPAPGPEYVVQPGDSLASIAGRFGVNLGAVKSANPQISDPNRIFAGQVITVPGSSPAPGPGYVVQRGDTLTAIAARFGLRLSDLEDANPQIIDANRIFAGQIITVASPAAFVRQNIWTLDQIDHWHPTIHAYARGVQVLIDRAAADQLDPIGWQYQSDIHGTTESPDQFRNQCQHFCWFFLPWHRMYLQWFERIIRSAIADLDDVDDQTKAMWALPYWDYSSDDPARRRLPQAFLDVTLRDGVTPNPLWVPGRNLNDGSSLPASDVDLLSALAPVDFAGIGGFAGGRTGFSHAGEDPGSAMGPLEGTPHGAVHVGVGGLMGSFNTAALDPIFWLHHCNIDRIWEIWRAMPDRSNSTEAAWLTGVTFHFHDENRAPLAETVQDVLDTAAQLGYSYDDIAAPFALEALMPAAPAPENPPELVGASDNAVALAGETTSVAFAIAPPVGPLAQEATPASRAYLRVEDVTSPAPVGVTYKVYLNVAGAEPVIDDDHFVGVAAFFGIEETSNPDNEHGGMRLAFDITGLYQRFSAEGRWGDQVNVTFVPQYVEPAPDPIRRAGAQASAPQEPGSARVGRVSVFLQ
ncbi:LysM peptidoglycan-binding domain-containing protein [Mycolicibacterium houstonense]|uniref:LysM peptidoglycan-binding domain-containing protein n=1 Tax=Mycolicibacterium houstonense TaxID=146021 RepID=UPI000833674C|nr:LysM peptidoglycan-binding domain-containing protein [Mycolicibacterium houstonense]